MWSRKPCKKFKYTMQNFDHLMLVPQKNEDEAVNNFKKENKKSTLFGLEFTTLPAKKERHRDRVRKWRGELKGELQLQRARGMVNEE